MAELPPLVVGLCDGMHFFPFVNRCIERAFAGRRTIRFVDLRSEVIAPDQPLDVLLFSVFGAVHDHYGNRTGVYRILVSGEPRSLQPYTGQCDLVIDTKDTPDLRPAGIPFLYLPLYVVMVDDRMTTSPSDLLRHNYGTEKPHCCAFMYSHDVPHRVRAFQVFRDRLKHQGGVDPLGKSGNPNPPQAMDRHAKNWQASAIEKYKPYRFVLAMESAVLPGYITEKLMHPILAGSVPVYLGAPDIFGPDSKHRFNARRFINMADYESVEKCAEFVQQLDNDPAAWAAMVAEPLFEPNVLPEYFNPDTFAERIVVAHEAFLFELSN